MNQREKVSLMSIATAPFTMTAANLTFIREVPGFRGAQHFVVEPLGDDSISMFARLRCTDTVYLSGDQALESLSFLVMSPGALWSDYELHLDETTVEELDLRDAEDAVLLVIVHPREPVTASTANLYSPIVFHRGTGVATQLVPAANEQEFGWSVSTPFPSSETSELSC